MKKLVKRTIGITLIIIIMGSIFFTSQKVCEIFNSQQGASGEIISKDGIVLVNKKYRLDRDDVPGDLQIPNIRFTEDISEEAKQVAGVMVEPLESLIEAANEAGVVLLGNSGYRSYQSQREVYQNRVRSEGRSAANLYVAKPGASEHQTGLCIDITNEARYFVKGTKEADWLAENCHRFGFIIRYPEGKEDITGILYEPWHIRYVGVEAAKEIYDHQMTLEEYFLK